MALLHLIAHRASLKNLPASRVARWRANAKPERCILRERAADEFLDRANANSIDEVREWDSLIS
jgi:hypothetical protein